MNEYEAAKVRLDGNSEKFLTCQRCLPDGPTYQSIKTFIFLFTDNSLFCSLFGTSGCRTTTCRIFGEKRKTSSGGFRKAVNLSGLLNDSHLRSSQHLARPRFSLALYIFRRLHKWSTLVIEAGEDT